LMRKGRDLKLDPSFFKLDVQPYTQRHFNPGSLTSAAAASKSDTRGKQRQVA
jgi:hypothetical protein